MTAAATLQPTPAAQNIEHAVDAAIEVDAIARALQRSGPEPDPALLRGMAIRLEHLASVAMWSLRDNGNSKEDVTELLYGPEKARERMAAA